MEDQRIDYAIKEIQNGNVQKALESLQALRDAAKPCTCMEKWIAQDGPECRPCALAPLTQWYRDELEKVGQTDRAHELESIGETGTPAEIAKALDDLKTKMPELVQRFREFDCMAQENAQ